eukprot:TRINITY_DN5762_c0_g1_i1.p1 TRINITY_DN5762_c0_g1~~TRINITY_DN5762_c0_g1_i1.p1  ORF type:complete len:199 (+),score=32.44 TRINITY_DN5762_c0_g1_i1:66-599(+)
MGQILDWEALDVGCFWKDGETLVGGSVYNDGERWCWLAIIDSEGRWISETQPEGDVGIFAEALVANNTVTLHDGHWQTFDSPFSVTMEPGVNGDHDTPLCVRVSSAGYEWHTDTSSFLWILADSVGNTVIGNEDQMMEMAKKIGVKQSINQIKYYHSAMKTDEYKEVLRFLESSADV